MKHITIGELHKFECVSSKCPYTCCAKWGVISIDPESAQYYQSVEGAFGEELRGDIDWDADPVMFKMRDERCPLLNEENLCRIYMELGPERMCETCRTYPRVGRIAGDLCFHDLTLSCPEAARIFMTRKRPLEFHVMERDDPQIHQNLREPDWGFFRLAEQAFQASVGILQNRAYPVAKRERALLIFQRSLQDALDAGNVDKAEVLIQYFSSPEHYSSLLDGQRPLHLASKVRLFRSLCELFLKRASKSPAFAMFYGTVGYLQSDNADPDAISRYMEALDGKEFQCEQEHLLVYLLFNHYLSNELLDKSANRDLFRRIAFILTLFQLYRTFTVIYSARQDKTVTLNDRVLVFSFLSRYFEHAPKGLLQAFMAFNRRLEENQFYDMNFLLDLIS